MHYCAALIYTLICTIVQLSYTLSYALLRRCIGFGDLVRFVREELVQVDAIPAQVRACTREYMCDYMSEVYERVDVRVHE